MSDHPPFEVFFAAAHAGRAPLPWQSRLASTVIAEGWPVEIGVPTGLGKTACLDIAVWALAGQASMVPTARTLQTRTWYVVNRRLLVDAAYEHGKRLAQWLANPEGVRDDWSAADEHVSALGSVGEALGLIAALGEEGQRLSVVRLRGGAEIGARPPDPSQPALIFATVPMFASRWLFRGYGTSASMRPVDAALAGIDSLVLLDEAHLAAPLAGMVEPLAACDPGNPAAVMPAGRCRPRFVALTATGSSSEPFGLEAEDYSNAIVRQRLEGAKPTSLVETSVKDLDDQLAKQAIRLLEDPVRRTCLVFVNTSRRARRVHELLVDRGCQALLITGRARTREADVLRGALLATPLGIAAGRLDDPERGRLWIVATQTLEVGADLDVDALVTQCAGVRALVQRFGRLNRLGERPHAAAVVCHAPDLDDPVYGDEPKTAWDRLRKAGDGVSLSPRVIASVLGEPADQLEGGHELLPSLVWEWVKTSIRTPGEAPPEAYFSAINESVARVSVCWRAHIPDPGVELWPSMSADESIEVPIGDLRKALEARKNAGVWRLADDNASVEEVDRSQLRPGDVVILEPNQGLYDQYGWNEKATESVLDVSLIRSVTLPLQRSVFNNLLTRSGDVAELVEMLKELETLEAEDRLDPAFDHEWAARVIETLRSAEHHPWLEACEWETYCDGLDSTVMRPAGNVAFIPSKPRAGRRRASVRADAFDELSFDVKSDLLYDHLESVGQAAGRIAERLGLPRVLCHSTIQAARWHDLGKADARFQRWLHTGGTSDQLLAKSKLSILRYESARAEAGWPKGGRHEALSSRLVQALLEQHAPTEDGELIVHLVASHHGHGRPSLPVVADPGTTPLELEIDGCSVRAEARLDQPDWSQPARFRRLCERYGYWGLALLESIVRLADHAVSGTVAG